LTTDSADPVDRIGPWRQERSDPGADDPARWVPVGTRSSGVLAMVDPAGLVGPVGGGWSLDWWIGAEDRWYLPAREIAVRQALVDNSPVVETRQRVPGGDIVHRVLAAQGPVGLGGREAIVVELTNETPVPVAVALAIRPYAVDADGSVRRIVPHDERTIGIDDAWTLIADRDARKVAATDDGTDPLAIVTRGEASASWEPVEDDRGRASLVLIFPLPHTASMRVALVAGGPPDDAGAALDGSVLEGLPGADAVASGWAQQADHGLRAVLPDEALSTAFTAARRRLVLGAPDLVEETTGTDQALIARAFAELGHHDDLRPVVGGLLERQRLNGAVPDRVGSEAATGAALALLGWWWRHDPRPDLLGELVGPIAKAAHRVERRRAGRRHRRDPKKAGLLPEGPQPVELGGPTMAYLDDWWSAAGLFEASALLTAAGQSEAAADAVSLGRAVLDDLDRSLRAVTPGLVDDVIPVGPDRSVDEAIIGVLPALAPLRVVDGADGRVTRTIELIRARLVGEGGWVRSGVAGATASPWLTACLAMYELEQGDVRAIDRLDWLVRAGGPTTSWPGRLDQRGVGRGGRGDDPVATALFVLLVRALLFSERRPVGAVPAEGLDILPVIPRSWLGQSIEVHDAPTTFGRFGFAIRWHGERPALLWELVPAPGAPVPGIACPSLAPGWSTSEPVGETLLPAPLPAAEGTVMMGDDVSFS
jgi:hypothetical protein